MATFALCENRFPITTGFVRTKHLSKYPGSLAHLTPNYLKTIPSCPAALKVTYEFETGAGAAYNSKGFQDYYFIKCAGTYHNSVSVPTNYPQYDAIQGLIDR